MSGARKTGTVARSALLRVKLVTDDGETLVAPMTSFDLRTSEGTMEIQVTRATRLAPVSTRRGAWSELESEPAAASFADRAPAPHAKATLEWFALQEGQSVEVRGAITASARGEAAHRQPALDRPTALLADVVAYGADAATLLQTNVPATRSESRAPLIVEAALLVLALGSVGAGALSSNGLIATDLVATGVFFGTAALVSRYQRRSPLVLHRSVRDAARDLDRQLADFGCRLWGQRLFMSLFMLFCVPPIAPYYAVMGQLNQEDHFNSTPLFLGSVAAIIAYWATLVFRAERHAARLARVMLGAPPASRQSPNAWSAHEGTVSVGRVNDLFGARAAIASIFEEEYREGSSPNIVRYVDQLQPFEVSGASVDPAGAVWGTTERVQGPDTHATAKDNARHFADVVSEGASALVVGRARVDERGFAFNSTGSESLLMFSTVGEPARAVLTRALRARTAMLLTLTIVVVALVAFALNPAMPPLSMGSGGD